MRRYILFFFSICMLIPRPDVCAQANDSTSRTTDSLRKTSGSVLKSKVIYSAEDSIRFDVANQKMFLFGKANVKYEDMVLDAAYIEFDITRNIAYSRGARDSSGRVLLDSLGFPIGDPVFSDGGKQFDAKEITYNFQTKKGRIREVTTKEGEAFIHAKDAKKDTGELYFVKNGKYTTCDLEHPHFYLKATKIKIIPDDKIICGPAFLAVQDVPTPLGIPFGVFPNKKGRKSGVIIPSYGESDLGFFLKDGGYYFGLSDKMDLALRGDIYSRGSFAVKAHSNYSKRYKRSGSLGFNFSQIQISEKDFQDYSLTRDYFLRWQHQQDAKSNPNSRFSANVNAGSRTYQKYNSNNENDYLSNAFQSNISWFRTWQGKPYNLSVNLSHSQSTVTKTVDVTMPEAVFNVARRYPFKRKIPLGKPRVYEKIGIGFSLSAKNMVTTFDTALFKESTLQKFRNGLKMAIPVSTSMNLGPLIITPSAGFNGYGYFKTIKKRYIAGPINDSIITDTLKGFKYAYDYNAALSFSTKLYGMFAFKNVKVKAIRHVVTPAISLSYRPDFGRTPYHYYDSVQINSLGVHETYPIFGNSAVYGYPQGGKAGFISFSLSNNLEMKLLPAKKDTLQRDRKIVLIENLTIASSYNLAADSMNWSPVSLSARTRLFKVADITLNATVDPYLYDSTLKKRVNTFEIDSTGKIGTVTSAALSLSTSLRSLVKKKEEKVKSVPPRRLLSYEDELNYIFTHPDYYVDFDVPWNLSVFYNIVYTKPDLNDTVIQSLTFSGDVNVTKKWKIGFHSGFDFVKKDFTFTSFDIYRDLHCWEMRLNWIPFGFRKSYMLTIAVKASVLQDLKLSRTRNWYDYN